MLSIIVGSAQLRRRTVDLTKIAFDGLLDKALSPDAIYQQIVTHCAKKAGVHFQSLSPHALRATVATTALDHGAGIAKVQGWLGHANVSITWLYDKRHNRAEESPTYKVGY